MIFSIGVLLLIVAFIYANFFMRNSYVTFSWVDAFFGLLVLLGFGLMILSLAILAAEYLP